MLTNVLDTFLGPGNTEMWRLQVQGSHCLVGEDLKNVSLNICSDDWLSEMFYVPREESDSFCLRETR